MDSRVQRQGKSERESQNRQARTAQEASPEKRSLTRRSQETEDGDGGGRMRGCAESGCLNVRDAWCVDAVVDACSVDSARMETRLAARRTWYLTYVSIQDAGHAALIPADSSAHALDWCFFFLLSNS